MPLGNLKVDARMRRRDGHRTRTEFHIGRLVLNDGRSDRPVDPFELDFLSVLELLVSLIGRMHHDIFVSELCFRPHRADVEGSVFEMIERIFLFYVFNFIIRNSGL